MSRATAFSAVLLVACGSEKPPLACGVGEIQSALAEATSGDTVTVCAGEFEGVFEVPAGVSLVGAGSRALDVAGPFEGATRLVGAAGADTVVLHSDASGTTSLSDLNVVAGRIAVSATGAGAAMVERVVLEVPLGVGVFADGVASFTMTDVTVRGSLTADNVNYLGSNPTVEEASTTGVLIQDVPDAALEGVDVQGFAIAGAAFAASTVAWSGGRSCGNSAAGIVVDGGAATLYDIDVCDLLQGFALIPPMGFGISGEANVQTTRVRVTGTEGGESIGVFQLGSTSQHQNLSVVDNRGTGVGLRDCRGTRDVPAFSLTGDESEIRGNRGYGIYVNDSTGVVVDGATISGTEAIPVIVGDLSEADVGDGVEIRSCAVPLADIRLAHLDIADSGRIGILVDANGGSAAGIEVEDVHVSGEGATYGAVVQNAVDLPVGWATEIVRTGATLANDEALSEELPIGRTCP